jgi:uncharacterized protein (DUF1501 family)
MQSLDERKARELEESFDPEMRFRPIADRVATLVAAALFTLSVFHYWTAGFGLLEETLVMWGGEFGRTVYSQGQLSRDNYGRDHHPRCFSVWLAGGGIKPGISWGKTDDFGYNVIENPVEVHDLHATMLHLLGFEHKRLTYRHEGRDYRLTDVKGELVRGILA